MFDHPPAPSPSTHRRIVHVALGGCLRAPPVEFGRTADTGGHIAYVLGAAQAQARAGHEVEIVTRAFEGHGPRYMRPREVVGPRCTIVRLATPNRAYLGKDAMADDLPALEAAFLAHLAPRPPDLVHAHFADAARLARAAHARFGMPWYYTPHSLGRDRGDAAPARLAQERAAIADAHAIVVSSRDEAERQVAAYVPGAEGRCHVIPPGVSPLPEGGEARARALLVPFLRAPERPLLLAIARPVRRKNLTGLVEAFARHPGLSARANLVILAGQRDDPHSGEPEQNEVIASLLSAVDRHGLRGRVALPPRHRAHDVAGLLRLAARSGGLLVNVAHHEPFGLTTLEAAAVGLPVVVTTRGGPAEVVARLGNGVCVEPTDTAAIGAAMAQLVTDRAAWSRAARSGLAGAKAYDWDVWARRAGRLASVPAAPHARPRAIAACDIDGTLTGDRAGARRFAAWAATRGDVHLAVATGRTLVEARRILAAWDLPEPDHWITTTGTEIWVGQGALVPCPAWAAHLRGWPRAATLAALHAAGATLQPEIEQRAHKIAVTGDGAEGTRIARALTHLPVRVVASHGRFIDVMPEAAGKGRALAFLARRHGLTLDDCVAAGDSGNDRDMLEAAGRAIVVANALPEIRDLPARPGLLRARAPHADGVLEGLVALGLHAAPLAAE